MMGPFYHKMIGVILIIGKSNFHVLYQAPQIYYVFDLKSLFDYFKGYNHKLIIGGGDMPLLKTDKLEERCNA